MNIRILHLIEGARQATGLTVIIDVFRAFSVEAILMGNRAGKVIPVADVQTAFDYKAKHPDTVLCGERGGAIIDGFDYGNSPSQLEHVDMAGKTVIHTTSAGTQGIANAIHASEIIGGNLISARAIAEYIRRQTPTEVSLVCMGLAGKTRTEEDTLCAEYIKSLLEGHPLQNMAGRIESLKTTSGAKFFDPAKQQIFPEQDFHICTRIGTVPFILRLVKDPAGGLPYMERVDVMGIPQDLVQCENTEETIVHPGDTIGMFTKEQVICFPDGVKERIVYGRRPVTDDALDCALVLGGPIAFMPSRAAAAAKLYLSGQVPLLMVTGGGCWETPFGYLSEAQTLARYLLEAGVPEEKIVIEDRATTTPENMKNCRLLLQEHFGPKRLRLAVVSSNFHVNRATVLSKLFLPGHDIFGFGAEYPKDNAQEYLSDPLVRQWVTKECRCLWSYVEKGWITDFPV